MGRSSGNGRKLWARDKSLWTGADEDRWLGWLETPSAEQIKALSGLRATRSSARVSADAVLLGMGGSSLGPEVLAEDVSPQSGFPESAWSSTRPMPAQIKAIEARLDLATTLFIVSSKSGSTLEPNAFTDYFFSA